MSTHKKGSFCVRFCVCVRLRGSLGSSAAGLVIGAQWSWGGLALHPPPGPGYKTRETAG